MKRFVISFALVAASMGAAPFTTSAGGAPFTHDDGRLYTGCLSNDDPMLNTLLDAGFTPEYGNPVLRCAEGTTMVGRPTGR